ncbi:MAG: hypothetical protein CO189_08560 [candidate division Zixibacteria bacterium CG_4_9_14_3_um_filter_46_8]|nr:MAG: hypothetical protein CO189_08560 [candidate division Zixibacteria bacterium CG_4_9_14_3_um_filter_46_8]
MKWISILYIMVLMLIAPLGALGQTALDSSLICLRQASSSSEPAIQEGLYKTAIGVKPDCAQCYFALGQLYLSQQKYNQALSEFYFAEEYNPQLVGLHYYIGLAFEMQNNFPSALDAYYLAIEGKSDLYLQSQAHLSIGSIFDAIAMPESAAVHFQKAIELDSASATAYFNLGITYDDRQMYEEAIKCYLKAHCLDTADTDIITNLGVAYCMTGNFDLAIGVFISGLALDPENYRLNYNLANAYQLNGELGAAHDKFEFTIKLQPAEAECYYRLAQVEESLGDFDSAAQNYDRFLELASPIYEIAVEEARRQLELIKNR